MGEAKVKRFIERTDGATPKGGAYAMTYYSDADGKPCAEEDAKHVEITEFT